MNKKAQTGPFFQALGTISAVMLWAFLIILLAAGIKWAWGALVG